MTSMIERLRRSVERTPAANAIVYGTARTTYEALWSNAGALAAFLTAEGLRPGTRVALLLPNSPAYVAAYYGALRARAAVVALNAQAKAGDIAAWLAHCGAEWLIVDNAHPELPRLAPSALERVRRISVGADAPGGPALRLEDICRDYRGAPQRASDPLATDLAAI